MRRAPETRIMLPPSIIARFSNSILTRFERAFSSREKTIYLDFSNVRLPAPFGVIISTIAISRLLEKGKGVIYAPPIDENAKERLRLLGFESFFNISPDAGRLAGHTVALRRFSSRDLTLAYSLAELLDENMNLSEDMKLSLTMSMREILLNAFDHSNCKEYYVCAQWYEAQQLIRICISDVGIGIKKSLSKCYEWIDQYSDCYAIKMAVEENITIRKFGGMGLSHIRRFVRLNQGRMTIVSGDGKVLYSNGRISSSRMNCVFTGTLINLEINADKKARYFLKSTKGVF